MHGPLAWSPYLTEWVAGERGLLLQPTSSYSGYSQMIASTRSHSCESLIWAKAVPNQTTKRVCFLLFEFLLSSD